MDEQSGSTRITISLDNKVLERLDTLAYGEGVKRPSMITMLINNRYKEVYGDDGFLCL